MSKSVVIEVTRGPVVESRHEGIAAIVQPDGAVVASWGDIDSLILPRSANKPIQAMAFVESGAVERFGLGNEHIALACASHSGEKRHVETVQAWLAKVGLSEADLECGTHAPRLQGTIEELARAGRAPTPAFNNCSGKHSRLPHHGGAVRRADQGLHQVQSPGAAPAARNHDRSLRHGRQCFSLRHRRLRYPDARHAAEKPGAGDGQHGRSVAAVEQACRGGRPHPRRHQCRAFHDGGHRPLLHAHQCGAARRGADQDRRRGRVLRHAADTWLRRGDQDVGWRRARRRSRDGEPCLVILACCPPASARRSCIRR